jgi:hypothetical protein
MRESAIKNQEMNLFTKSLLEPCFETIHPLNPLKKVAQKVLKKFQGLMYVGASMRHKEVNVTQGTMHILENYLWDIV